MTTAPHAAAFLTAQGVTFTEQQALTLDDFAHGDSLLSARNVGEVVAVVFESSPEGEAFVFPTGDMIVSATERLAMLNDAPDTCPKCGSEDVAVFAASEDREDEADLTECNACRWTAALTPYGVASLAEGEVPTFENRERQQRGRKLLLNSLGNNRDRRDAMDREELEESYVDAIADLLHAAVADGLDISKVCDLVELHLDEELEALGR